MNADPVGSWEEVWALNITLYLQKTNQLFDNKLIILPQIKKAILCLVGFLLWSMVEALPLLEIRPLDLSNMEATIHVWI